MASITCLALPAEKLLGGFLVPATLHQNVEDVIILIHRAPQIMPLAVDGEEHLIKMPFVPRARPAALELVGVLLPKLSTPLADGLVPRSNKSSCTSR
jgi:hypothetical protein